jgi:hypothetical protein
MAGKGIDIKITTLGGDQAATEITKVKGSIDSQVVSISKLEEELRDATAAYKAAAVGSEEFLAASKRVNQAKAELSAAANKVTTSSANMRFGLQNVGYQVQDFAVQLQGGTSATRAFAQQAPQLLSALGPWGVALGTVVALGAPLIPMLMGQAQSAEALSDAFDESTKKMADIISKQESASWKEFVIQLDNETEALKRNNEALGRKKELTDAIEAANKELDAARQKAVKDEIDADPTMSDADKIRAKGAVDDAAARKAAAEKIKKLEDAAKAAEAEKAAKVKAAEDASNDADETRARVGSDAEEIARLEKRKADVEKNRRTAEQQLPQAESDSKWLYAKKYLGTGLPGDAERTEKSEAADLRLANLKAMANDEMSSAEEGRLTALKGEQAKKQAELDKREAAEKEAREAANKAGLDAENKRAILTETAPRIREAYQVESQSRRATTESRAAEAERIARQRAQDKAKQDADREARTLGGTAELEGPGLATDAARSARGLGLEKYAKAFEKMGNEIARPGDDSKMGSDQEILERIMSTLESIVEHAPNHGKGTDKNTGDMRGIMTRLSQLEGRVKNMRKDIDR